jgi:hypothetical protein
VKYENVPGTKSYCRVAGCRSLVRAQGIAAESPQEAQGRFPRTWSGKPGFWRFAPKMRPNSEMEILQIYKKIYEILSICGTILFC